jgi:hypothetical protein
MAAVKAATGTMNLRMEKLLRKVVGRLSLVILLVVWLPRLCIAQLNAANAKNAPAVAAFSIAGFTALK